MKQMTEAQLRKLLEEAWQLAIACALAHPGNEREIELVRDQEINALIDNV